MQYPVINRHTGETQTLSLSIEEWGKWKIENEKDGWSRDWSQGCASFAETGEWRDKLDKKHPDWKHVLKSAEKSKGLRY